MPALVPDLLSLLRAHSLVQSLRVLHHDETPLGKVESLIPLNTTDATESGAPLSVVCVLSVASVVQPRQPGQVR